MLLTWIEPSNRTARNRLLNGTQTTGEYSAVLLKSIPIPIPGWISVLEIGSYDTRGVNQETEFASELWKVITEVGICMNILDIQ